MPRSLESKAIVACQPMKAGGVIAMIVIKRVCKIAFDAFTRAAKAWLLIDRIPYVADVAATVPTV
jgi:hypothetical protein